MDTCAFETIELTERLDVRSVAGTLVNEGGELWPEVADLAIELVSVRDSSTRYTAHAEIPSGRFHIDGVPQGEYWFRAGVRPLGWKCIEGHVTVSRSAAADERMRIIMLLGE